MEPYMVVLGSINNDLIISTKKLPQIGETVVGSGFMTAPGGKGANQAVAAARLGAHVRMIGAVGDDVFGAQLKRNLRDNGVDESGVRVWQDCPSGTAVIVLYQGDNSIIVDQGANNKVTALSETDEAWIRDAALLIVQLEIPIETVVQGLTIARAHGVKTLLNPAPARPLPDHVLKLCDIVTPNETECEIITGIQADTVEGAKRAVAHLLEIGVQHAVVTMGANGAVYFDGHTIRHQQARPAKAVLDTTAAGDSFTAGLAVALSEGRTFAEAVTFAQAVGSLVVAKLGAQPSLPYRREVDEVLANG